ncbi:MAG: hypothetical protein H3C35_07510 [Bacteroidetes bacterium]|nr:hypothetical protein [Bacteroidota bacterium]
MPTYVDELIQEANALSGVMDKYSTQLADAGFGEPERNEYKLAVADLLAKDSAQKNSIEIVRQKTTVQNDAMTEALELFRTVQIAARAAYGENDKTMLKEFHVGKEKINTVKVMTTELAYMKGVAIKHQSDLAKNGFSANDITSFDTLSQNLVIADTEQENAKKAQASATAVRDKSWDNLQKLVKKVRNIAKVKFRKDEDILNEFSSITVKRNSAKVETPATPQATEQKK